MEVLPGRVEREFIWVPHNALRRDRASFPTMDLDEAVVTALLAVGLIALAAVTIMLFL